MSAFNILGLDSDFQIIQALRATNVQWNRKYHESGDFSIQLPLEQYTPDLTYIYTASRPEMGVIKTRNYVSVGGYSYIQIKGFFLENELSRMIVYQNGTTNITNNPTWEFKDGAAEDVALAYYNAFKKLQTADHEYDLGITATQSEGRGNYSIHYRNGEDLAYKLYDILKPSGMSYKVLYDLDEDTKTLSVWSGLDRTQDNTDGNNPIIFSTKYGNIVKPNITIDEEDYCNAAVVIHETSENNQSTFNVQVAFNDDADPRSFMFMRTSLNKTEYTQEEFEKAMRDEGLNKLADYAKTINLEFDAMAGSYEYMTDFDLGDLCSVEVPDMGFTADVRLIGCYEVMKNGEWTLTMEFGTPIIN